MDKLWDMAANKTEEVRYLYLVWRKAQDNNYYPIALFQDEESLFESLENDRIHEEIPLTVKPLPKYLSELVKLPFTILGETIIVQEHYRNGRVGRALYVTKCIAGKFARPYCEWE